MALLNRKLENQLPAWKRKAERLPLILWGARQVGKSTSVGAFGASHFPQVHTFNFQKSPQLNAAFQGNLNPREILNALEIISGKKVGLADLLFLDEIQECPEAVTTLKYFAEALPAQAVIAAGSYLGLVRNESAFPVGKVEFLSLHPMSFFEFLENMEPATHAYLQSQPAFSHLPLAEFYHQRALYWLRVYLCVGGMPAAVVAFQKEREAALDSLRAARQVQEALIEGYQADFAKHSGTVNANHILRVFDSTATQLGRALDESVGRFKFTGVLPGKKGFEPIDGPLSWLERSRLVIKTYLATRFEQPLKAFSQSNYFKAYFFDVGILNAILSVPVEALLRESLGSYKGYLAENFVAQELFSVLDQPLVGWTEGESEVEFVISRGAELCPIEVKASARTRRAKSLDTLIAKYHPELSLKLTGQNRGYSPGRKILTLPLYLASRALSA